MTKKATGIVRKVDELGRIVLPKELRRVYGINPNDSVEIFVTGEEIILRKYQPVGGCTLCGSIADKYAELGDKRICPGCAGLIVERFRS